MRCKYGDNVWIWRYTTLDHKRLKRPNMHQEAPRDEDAGLFLLGASIMPT